MYGARVARGVQYAQHRVLHGLNRRHIDSPAGGKEARIPAVRAFLSRAWRFAFSWYHAKRKGCRLSNPTNSTR
jgi:hypothetical protein